MVVKGCDFTTDQRFFITGTPEFDVNILPNIRPEGYFPMIVKTAFLLILLSWLVEYFMR